MEKSRKLELIQEQIEQSLVAKQTNSGTESWSLTAFTTLRVTLGEDHFLCARATTVRFSPIVVNLGDNSAAFAAARSHGVDEMVSILHAAQFEIQESEADAPEAENWVHPDLWAHVSHLVEGRQWEQVVSTASVFFEDWTRRKAGLSNTTFGVDVMNAAFDSPGGVLSLGRSQPAGEGQGWALLAKGFSLAISNSSRHRIDARPDAEAYAMGALGAVSLLMTQVNYEHP